MEGIFIEFLMVVFRMNHGEFVIVRRAVFCVVFKLCQLFLEIIAPQAGLAYVSLVCTYILYIFSYVFKDRGLRIGYKAAFVFFDFLTVSVLCLLNLKFESMCILRYFIEGFQGIG